MKRKYHLILTYVLLLAVVKGHDLFPVEYEVFAEIESIRKGSLVTLSFPHRPEYKNYFILDDGKVIGTAEIKSCVPVHNSRNMYRVVAYYILEKESLRPLLIAGNRIALAKMREPYRRDFPEAYHTEKILYKPGIVGKTDRREMILVPGGKFVFGSNTGDRDEYPQQWLYIGDFYIDKYEVSNRDYGAYMDDTSVGPPLSWEGPSYGPDRADLPVLVTYHEAENYARWAGKRLPTEEEWEKAARGAGTIDGDNLSSIEYPWGMEFSPDRVNSLEFWADAAVGEEIKKDLKDREPSPLPITMFSRTGASPYGAVNMSGNAMEWTSSWYMPYKNNHYKNRKYGKQYKVIRGGAWFSKKDALRVTRRQIGGIPNLYRDNIAGFRCVKNPAPLDQVEKIE